MGPNDAPEFPISGEGAGKADDWVLEFGRIYWLGPGPNAPASELMADLLDLVPESEKELKLAFQTFRDSVGAIQEFLGLPYAIARGVLDQVGIPGLADEDIRARAKLLADAVQGNALSPQLLRMKQQAVLLLWSAYESYARDMFVAAMNGNASLLGNVLKSPLREKFQTSQLFSYTGLEKYDFSLNQCMGAAMADGRDFSSPGLLRVLFQHLLPDCPKFEELSKACEAPELWVLGHRRHVIAHRAGVVDESYLNVTGDKAQVAGEPLQVTGAEIDRAIWSVAWAAAMILINVGHARLKHSASAAA